MSESIQAVREDTPHINRAIIREEIPAPGVEHQYGVFPLGFFIQDVVKKTSDRAGVCRKHILSRSNITFASEARFIVYAFALFSGEKRPLYKEIAKEIARDPSKVSMGVRRLAFRLQNNARLHALIVNIKADLEHEGWRIGDVLGGLNQVSIGIQKRRAA